VYIFAHPTGRLLGRREPYSIDMVTIARFAADTGVLIEIDAQPERLDLDDVHIKMAKEAGARFVIDTDAHGVGDLEFMRFGVDQARRGWLTAGHVANTLDLDRFQKLIETPRRVPAAASIRSRPPAGRRGRRQGDFAG